MDALATSPPGITKPSRITPWRVLAWLVNALAFIAFAWVVVHWGWLWFVPRTQIRPAEAPANPSSVIVASGLFGNASNGQTTAMVAPAASASHDARLLGVVAEPGGKGYAVFRLPSGPRVVSAGDEIAQGTTLMAVRPDGVTVREGGVERAWSLRPSEPAQPKTSAPADKAATTQSTSARTTVSAAGAGMPCAPPPGFRGQVIQLNVELLDGLIAQPDTWRGLLEPAKGALVIRDAGGFAAMLGLQQGDRVEQANGIALSRTEDVVAAVLKPLRANQPVHVIGHRGQDPRELWLVNVGCVGKA